MARYMSLILCGLAHPPSVSGSWLTTWTNSVGKYDEAMPVSILMVGMDANPSR
jgi:hypothetical protein